MEQAGDSIPARLIPFSLLGWGTVTLDPFRADLAARGPFRWYAQERRGSLVSYYPVGVAFVALPIYVPYYLWLRLHGHTSHDYLFAASQKGEKLAAAVIAALAVAVLSLLIRPRVGTTTAATIALAFGLGSGIWAVASQVLWQHGPAVLCLLLGTACLMRRRGAAAAGAASGLAVAAGFCFGMAYAVRPPTAVFLPAAAAIVALGNGSLTRRIGPLLSFALGALLPVAATLAYNRYYYGTLLGGYGMARSMLDPAYIPQGLPGLLLSPNRGLLVFSPVAVLGLWGVAAAWRRPRAEPILAALSAAAAAFVVLHASISSWMAGWSFGPRFLTEILPILALAAALTVPRLGRRGRAVALLLVAWSVLVELDGVVCYPASAWNARMTPDLESHAWDFRHLMLVEDFQAWRAQRAQR